MSEPTARAKVVEVFPMRLGAEVLVDVSLEPEGEDFPEPKPEDLLVLDGPDGPIELEIWAAPRIPHGKGVRRVNVQFRRETEGLDVLTEGAVVELRKRSTPGS